MRYLIIAAAGAALLAGCGQSETNTADTSNFVTTVDVANPDTMAVNVADPANDVVLVNTGAAAFVWPSSLVVVGDGYPAKGDPCRIVGESSATSNYLDHTATLVGCPTAAAASEITALLGKGGKKATEVDGVTLISVPTGK